MLKQRIHGDWLASHIHHHGACVMHGLVAPSRRVCAASPWGSASAVVILCRHASTTALPGAPTSPSASSGTASMSNLSRWKPLSTTRSARLPPPPPLSLLSWAVDGSGHTHHRCRRRLSMAERIPLVCETIYAAAPDVVALQDSTPELAEALICCSHEGAIAKSPGTAPEGHLRIHCAELARSLLQQQEQYRSASPTSSESPPPVAPISTQASSTPDCHGGQPQATVAPAPVAGSPTSPAALLRPCRYRLVGSARNGRCGEVQLFIKEGSVWDAELLPGMGAGLTVELRCRTPAALPPHSSMDSVLVSDTTSAGAGNAATAGMKQADGPESPCHRCVLTTLDLSYRGKSLGTNAEGLLADAAVSAEGSPFTLQTQQPSSSFAAKRHGRAPGQLDAHRAMALDWVHHHVRPDVLVGNLFTGAQEHVPGFEDSWVRAGSPSGQERTTNTCARHRVDHTTNYYYFRPSRHVASSKVMERLMRMYGDAATATCTPSLPTAELSATHGTLPNAAGAGGTGGQVPVSTSTVVVAVAADAPIGTPIPLGASWDSKKGSWQLSSFAREPALAKVAGHRDSCSTAASPPGEPHPAEGDDDHIFASNDITMGMPEVAGRFQRCLLRGWMRRGPASRSGHLSAHPFLNQYRRCRVVVLRPTVEVVLSAAEQAWHTRYITAQYSRPRLASSTPSAAAEVVGSDAGSDLVEAGGTAVDASHTTRVGGASCSSPRQAQVSSRVRCSVSDQYPLLTLLG
ncbi:hypothetical protein JKF63_05280 [Porcisia hertigi]|uniref:Uncharacterized protein n=1 Tax=Porcisia hertigi TaxID=2761500 RepID=A0A836HZT1_9TRYP|nr:hypothetical protein JKF63_05280 [Porcisia hertigi]